MNNKSNNIDIENNNSKNKRSKKNIKVIICIILIVFLITFFTIVVFIYKNKINTKVYKNIYLLEENISGKEYLELKEYLEGLNNLEFNINIFQDNNKLYNVSKKDIDFKIDVSTTLNNVFEVGRNSGTIRNNINILKTMINGKVVEVCYTYDDEKLTEILKNIKLSINDIYVDDVYYVENDTLVIIRGKSGYTINIEEEKNNILTIFRSSYLDSTISNEIKLSLEYVKPKEVTISDIIENVKCDATDARVDETLGITKFIASKNGYDFDEKDLESVLEENKNELQRIEYKLNLIEPKVNIEDLDYAFYKNKLSGFTTYVSNPEAPKAHNMEIALGILNETIVMPGEIFSYNQTLGEITASKGYVEAPTYKGGTTVNEVGGGICQTVSTLYNAVIKSDLEIVERYQHGLPVSYVVPSADATVYSPNLDFKFKNTRTYPIKIITNYSNGTINVNIYGTYEEKEYDIVIESEKLSTTKYDTKYIYDSTLEKDKEEIVVYGMDGYTSQAFVIKSLNGKEVSKTLLSKDTYNPQTQIIKIGTKE